MKAANKGAKAPAELPEGRASTKGNSQDQSTYRTQGRVSVSQAVERIRQAATKRNVRYQVLREHDGSQDRVCRQGNVCHVSHSLRNDSFYS